MLDITDLLQGENTGNLTDCLHFSEGGSGDTVVDVDTYIGSTFDDSTQITLTGIDLTVDGTLTYHQILGGLLAEGNFIVIYKWK